MIYGNPCPNSQHFISVISNAQGWIQCSIAKVANALVSVPAYEPT